MNRTIKFKAFIPKLGIWLEEIGISTDNYLLGVSLDYLEEIIDGKFLLVDEAIVPLDYFKANSTSEALLTLLPGEDYCWIENGDYELVQFTGLLDKDGREIYEGDVLTESIYDIPAVYCGEDVSVVVFRYSAFRKVARDRYTTMNIKGKYGEVYQGDLLEPYGGVLDNIGNVSVIGNIYENPELLDYEP